MKLKTWLLLAIALTIIATAAVLQSQTFRYPDKEEIDKRVNYLERVIQQPPSANAEIWAVSAGSYEWVLFSYSFASYAMTNLALKDSTYKERAIEIIRTSIDRSLEEQIFSSYGIERSLLEVDSIPDNSVLYLGHLNLMLDCYRLLSSDSTFNRLNDKLSGFLFRRYSNSKFLNLESYPNRIWIPDNTVALASLKLHSANTGSQFGSICDRWISYVKEHYIHKETGLLHSTINPETGEALEQPRGSMIGWSTMFIHQFDPVFARQLYHNYKEHFSTNLLVFRLFRERHNRMTTDAGDIDSGPLFLGYSIPANEFALSNAIMAGDYKTARQLERLITVGANKSTANNEIRYKVRFVDLQISPLAEALVLHSLTITKWTNF